MTELKALVVEHDEESRQLIDEVLLAIGHKYEIATSLAGAREMLSTNGYAYVLLNCMIPARPGGMPRRQNAENFLDDLRNIKGEAMPPVIVLFDPMPEADEEFKVSWSCDLAMRGARRFVQKPFRTEGRTLDRVIKRVLAGQREPAYCPVASAGQRAEDVGDVVSQTFPPLAERAKSPDTRCHPEASPPAEDGTASNRPPGGAANLAPPAGGDPRWASVPNEAVEIDDFMARFCEQRSKENRMYRKRALLAAARHGTITLPPLAGPRKHGQPNRFFVHDLLASWQGFLDEGVNLPPLRPQPTGSYKTVERDRAAATDAKGEAALGNRQD